MGYNPRKEWWNDGGKIYHECQWWLRVMRIRNVRIWLTEQTIIGLSVRLLLWIISESRDIVSAQSTLTSLIDLLPFHHRSTLHYLMTHLCRVCRLQVDGGHQEPLSSLCLVFSHILLRPAWENIMWVLCYFWHEFWMPFPYIVHSLCFIKAVNTEI